MGSNGILRGCAEPGLPNGEFTGDNVKNGLEGP